MKYPFKKKDETLDTYIFNLKETCIVEHEDNWFKEKSHTKLYPNIEEAKLKISKPHYWILNLIDEYEDPNCEDKELKLIELGQLVFKSNYYSKKLTSETPNEEAKIDLAQSLNNLGISINKISEQMTSMDTPKYARLNLELNDAKSLITAWINI